MTSFPDQQTPTGTASPDISVGREQAPCLCDSAHNILVEERRELWAACFFDVMGERDATRRALVEMLAQVEARRAVREAGCFFDSQGELDAKTAQKHAGEGAS